MKFYSGSTLRFIHLLGMKKALTTATLTLLITYSFAPVALAPVASAARGNSTPSALAIPAIGLGSPIVPMGLTKAGDLDVPSGTTNNVGWYAKGTVPGETGSAVLDAHVYAAFANLHKVTKGDTIYVVMKDGTTREFKVTKTKVFKLSDLSSEELFNQDDGRYLHLITCAGELTADHSTYTHRLVVYATLVK